MYEKLYSQYLEFLSDVNDEGWISIHCPFHGDEHQSAGVNIYSGVFHCYAKCGPMSPYTFLQRLLQITKEDVISLIDEFVDEFKVQLNIESDGDKIRYIKSPSELGNVRVKIEKAKLLLSEDNLLIQSYLQSRGLSFETLVRKGVGFLEAKDCPEWWQKDLKWERDSLVIPYTINNKIIGIHYRDILGNKTSEKESKFHLYSIDEVEDQDAVILVEGETDNYKTFENLDYKYTVVSSPTATFNKEWTRHFQDVRQVIGIHQADEAAEKMVASCRKYLGEKYTPLELPWGRKDVGKDVCDWINIHGKEQFQNLIQSILIPKSRRIMNGFELIEEGGVEQPWIIKNCLAERQSAMIGGYAKTYKTWIALNMCKCILTPGSKLFNIDNLKSKDDYDKNVLFIEEEGNISELKIRATMVLKDVPDWQKRVFWMHQMGLRLDDASWEIKLKKIIEEYNIGVIFFDPLQRLFTGDENDSSTIGVVWSTIARLLVQFSHLAVVIIHHFKKSSEQSEGLRNIRGSSRLAGEIDLGILCYEQTHGVKVEFKGRSIPHLVSPDGKDTFRLAFEDGIMNVDGPPIVMMKDEALVAELDNRFKWNVDDAATFFGKDKQTILNWAKKQKDKIKIFKGDAGQKPYLQIILDSEKEDE